MTDDERGRVEKIAKAIYYADSAIHAWEDVHSSCHNRYRTMAIAAMREGEQKQEGEARAAGDVLDQLLGRDGTSPAHVPLSMYSTVIAELKRRVEAAGKERDAHKWEAQFQRSKREAAESLAKAEREGRESEGVAYRKEIASLKGSLDCAASIANDQRAGVGAMSDERDSATRELARILRERDEARAELADAKATIAHWKHIACDPQTRENINAEKVAECERLRAMVEAAKEMRAWIDVAEQFTTGDEKAKAAARFDEALAGRTGT